MSDAVALARLRILSLAAVSALVSTRVYTGMLPQSVTLPAVLVQFISDAPTSHLRGGNSLRQTRIQVTSVATTRAEATALDAAIAGSGDGTGLAYWSGGIGSPEVQVRLAEPLGAIEEFVGGELRQFRVIRDYRVHHR